ncbi:allophanate hydrolase-related protein [Martelella mediterranea]|nr:hypothetical protein [Martelella mediterranea]
MANFDFYALSGGPPVRPGLVRDPGPQASSIAVDIWAVPMSAFGRFMAGIPSPLSIGSVSLADGTAVKGFICEAEATATASEITSLGSWRRFIALQTVC